MSNQTSPGRVTYVFMASCVIVCVLGPRGWEAT